MPNQATVNLSVYNTLSVRKTAVRGFACFFFPIRLIRLIRVFFAGKTCKASIVPFKCINTFSWHLYRRWEGNCTNNRKNIIALILCGTSNHIHYFCLLFCEKHYDENNVHERYTISLLYQINFTQQH